MVVFVSDIQFEGLHQRPQHLAEALSAASPVLWLEPATLSHRASFRVRPISKNLFALSIPVIPYNARNAVIRRLARAAGGVPGVGTLLTAVQLRLVQRALKALGSSARPTVAVVHNFHAIGLVRRLSPQVVVYDYIDNAFGFTALPSRVRDLWVETIDAAGVITVTSPGLGAQIREAGGKNAVYIGNGVEVERFAASGAARPADLPEGKPVVVYVGAVYPWLDYALLSKAAKRLTDVNFVLIGPVHPDAAAAVEDLKRRGNVVALGVKPYQALPAYLHYSDIGIIPFQKNELTRTVNPVKLYEYSAAGLPTIATDFSDDVRAFRGLVTLVASEDEFAAAVRTLLARRGDQAGKERLVAFAREHDWRQITKEFIDIINRQQTTSHASI